MTTTSTFRRSSSSGSAGRATRVDSGPPGGRLGPAHVRWTGRAEGDLGLNAAGDVAERRSAVHAGPWAWAHQVHGTEVQVVERPGGTQGADGDALVTTVPGVALAVFTADCAPVALASSEGVIGIAHAGWRGLDAGVLTATVAVMSDLGASTIVAGLGPCIRPCCYEFGEAHLARMAARFGAEVEAVTRDGRPAFDLPRAVARELGTCGVEVVWDAAACTSCDPGWYSHRARTDRERQATIIMVEG